MRRVVLGLVALVMVGVSMPEAQAARIQPTAAPSHAAPRNVTVMSFNACGAACRRGEVVRALRVHRVAGFGAVVDDGPDGPGFLDADGHGGLQCLFRSNR